MLLPPVALLTLLLCALVPASAQEPTSEFFTSPFTLDEMAGKQAVVETTAGAIVMQLVPETAPNTVAHFMTLAQNGEYVGTVFHRVVPNGIIQGGDPVTKDPDRVADYGSGGMRRLRAEGRDVPHTAGVVTAVTFTAEADSAGSQFIICIGAQPAFDGQFTVFARVVEGMEVVQAISNAEANADGLPLERISITSVTIRDTPPEPFVEPEIQCSGDAPDPPPPGPDPTQLRWTDRDRIRKHGR